MPIFTQATPDHRETLAEMLRGFYAEEHLDFTDETLVALDDLLATPSLGQVYLIHDAPTLAGYFALTFSFSLERAGKTALLDELYILPPSRRKGFGKAALVFAVACAKRHNCKTLLLEVAHANPAAQALYTSLGFATLPRHYLTLPL